MPARPWLPDLVDTPGPRRRAILLAGLVLPLAACTRAVAPAPRPVDPDVALRSAAADREVALLSMYDRALVAASAARAPGLAALRGEHADHLNALGPAPSANATPSAMRSKAPSAHATPSTTTADLLAAEAAAAAAHADGVSPASRTLAALLATLSAAEAAHAVALPALPV